MSNERGCYINHTTKLPIKPPNEEQAFQPLCSSHQGMVSSMMVDPARAPTPTDSSSCASSPIPEKRTIAPSGTAPKTGRTTDPTMPARDGTSSRSSDPSEIMLDALEKRGNTAQRSCKQIHKYYPLLSNYSSTTSSAALERVQRTSVGNRSSLANRGWHFKLRAGTGGVFNLTRVAKSYVDSSHFLQRWDGEQNTAGPAKQALLRRRESLHQSP